MLAPTGSHNPADQARPWTLLLNLGSWAQIPRQPAPPRDRKLGYTLDVPNVPLDSSWGTK